MTESQSHYLKDLALDMDDTSPVACLRGSMGGGGQQAFKLQARDVYFTAFRLAMVDTQQFIRESRAAIRDQQFPSPSVSSRTHALQVNNGRRAFAHVASTPGRSRGVQAALAGIESQRTEADGALREEVNWKPSTASPRPAPSTTTAAEFQGTGRSVMGGSWTAPVATAPKSLVGSLTALASSSARAVVETAKSWLHPTSVPVTVARMRPNVRPRESIASSDTHTEWVTVLSTLTEFQDDIQAVLFGASPKPSARFNVWPVCRGSEGAASSVAASREAGSRRVLSASEDGEAVVIDDSSDDDEAPIAKGTASKGLTAGERSLTISAEDIQHLLPEKWLNSHDVEFGIRFSLRLHCTPQARDLSCLFSTYLFSSLAQGVDPALSSSAGAVLEGYDRVRRWSKHVDIFSQLVLIIPVHAGGHWSLAVILNPAAAAKSFHASSRVEDTARSLIADLEASLVQSGAFSSAQISSLLTSTLGSDPSDIAIDSIDRLPELRPMPTTKCWSSKDPTPYPGLALLDQLAAMAESTEKMRSFPSPERRASSGFLSPEAMHEMRTVLEDDDPLAAKCVILHLDSLGSHSTPLVGWTVRHWLAREWLRRRGSGRTFGYPSHLELARALRTDSKDPSLAIPTIKLKVPRQRNGCDCGVYVVGFARCILARVTAWVRGSEPAASFPLAALESSMSDLLDSKRETRDKLEFPESLPLEFSTPYAVVRPPPGSWDPCWAIQSLLTLTAHEATQLRNDMLLYMIEAAGGSDRRRLALSVPWDGVAHCVTDRPSDTRLFLQRGMSPEYTGPDTASMRERWLLRHTGATIAIDEETEEEDQGNDSAIEIEELPLNGHHVRPPVFGLGSGLDDDDDVSGDDDADSDFTGPKTNHRRKRAAPDTGPSAKRVARN
jgi:hypothetical protein